MSRAIIVANKTWEADPLVEFLMSPAAKAPLGKLSFQPATASEPRWRRGRLGTAEKWCEIVCVQDALEAKFASNSKAKAEVLRTVLAGDDVALVLAFGTASTFGDVSNNGSVVVGTRVFLHDPRSPRSDSDWRPDSGALDAVLESGLDGTGFEAVFVNSGDASGIEKLLVVPPHNPAAHPALLASRDAVALSEINVTNYVDYVWSDLDTVAAYLRGDPAAKIGSLETTHGVIRLSSSAAFAFISGIVDRLGHFYDEVDDVQNFVGAHNAGIAVAFFVPRLLAWLK